MAEGRGTAPKRGERGAGFLGSVLGVGIVLALVALATNVCLGLWVRSTVDSVAYDTARHVATAPPGSEPNATEAAALARARGLLGRYGQTVDLRFEHAHDAEVVVLHVRAPGNSPFVGALDRRIVMTREYR